MDFFKKTKGVDASYTQAQLEADRVLGTIDSAESAARASGEKIKKLLLDHAEALSCGDQSRMDGIVAAIAEANKQKVVPKAVYEGAQQGVDELNPRLVSLTNETGELSTGIKARIEELEGLGRDVSITQTKLGNLAHSIKTIQDRINKRGD